MTDPWNEIARMIVCGLTVAAVAVPLGLVAWGVGRRAGEPRLPRPRGWRVPWGGFEVFAAFVVVAVVVPPVVSQLLNQSDLFTAVYGPAFPLPGPVPEQDALAAAAGVASAVAAHDQHTQAATVRLLWTGLLALPLQLGLVVVARRTVYADWRPPPWPGVARAIALAVAVWVAFTPVVLAVHFGVGLAFDALGWTVEEHPLALLTTSRPLFDRILFVVQACVSAPLVEEVLFRGVLLPWLLGGKHRTWPVLVVGVVVAAAFADLTRAEDLTRGPVLFAVALLVGWSVLRCLLRSKVRTVGAVYASSALFAVIHSTVWPSPIPLFVLGLGLGWVAVRTRGVVVPALVHGLFNAVSVVFVLRG